MITNALLLNDEMVNLLSDARIEQLQLTLDGSEQVHDRIGRRNAKGGFLNVALLPNLPSTSACVITKLK